MSPHIKEVLAIHCVLNKLGFRSSDIFVVAFDDAYGVEIKHNDTTVFTINTGILTKDYPYEQFQEDWTNVCADVNSYKISDLELNDIIEGSYVYKHKVDLISSILAKGLSLPYTEDTHGKN